ncbi:MAG: hypothetical protein ACHRXM_22575 [Isosphaerales bacterium]
MVRTSSQLGRTMRHLRIMLLVCILGALLGGVWVTDSPSPSYPHGEFPVILIWMLVVVGLVGALVLIRRSASRGFRDRSDV